MARRAAPHRGTDIHYGDADDDSPSRSALKRQAEALQVLGKELSELPENRLTAIDMPDGLRRALADYRRTKGHEARRRQLQYVGKQMRFADEAPLREAVAAFKLGSAKDTLRLHETERVRDELVASDDALTQWAKDYPDSDLQRLRNLVRNARKDAAANPGVRSGKGYRELFQFVKPWLAGDGALSAADAADGDDQDDDQSTDDDDDHP
jgi:ribosome-associated protein